MTRLLMPTLALVLFTLLSPLSALVARADSPEVEASITGPQPGAGAAPEEPSTLEELAESTLGERLGFTFEKIRTRSLELLALSPLLLVALLLVFASSWLGRFVARRLHWLRLHTENPYMAGVLRALVRSLITLAGVLLALDLLNATTLVGAVLGSAGMVGLVMGFAFKDIAENYIASVLLSMRRPFSPGDHVRIDAHEGKVMALTSRATMLMTLDGNELRLPNSLVFKAVTLNFSSNPRRRFGFEVTIDGAESIWDARGLALSQIASVPGVLEEPGPSCGVKEYGPGGVVLQLNAWVDQRESDLGRTRSEAIRRVKGEFGRAGIEGPRTVHHVVTLPATPAASTAGAPREKEPVRGVSEDTSVDRDIDAQIAEAQQQLESGRNLLEAGE